ncbi:hypothetical protein EZ281_02490 [Salmonella enterica]|nr:hypothetical protein [Salmonella enterica]ECI4984171.1 hypothetical protein [Salmonella enterica subsp. salamae]EHJ5090567.1 hypothetical protein [Salmonella enterica subsp. salamae serovar 16:m,t:-]EAV1730695.1 hypothetical protein [Salmonella enterica]EBK3132783.1 hypothetical protein [Salmonella enterica]
MTKTEYMTALQDILRMHTQEAVDKICRIKNILPVKTSAVEVGIHPSQDEEGMFCVMIHLRGPDLYVLNKAIAPYRELFEVKFIDGNLQPEVPLFDPDEVSFSVNDLIVEVGIVWVKQIWALSGGLDVPAYVFGEECSAPKRLLLPV